MLERVHRVLSADPTVTTVAYWDGRSNTDVIVAYTDDEAARQSPRFVVTADDHLAGRGMTKCNPLGLAEALAVVAGGTLKHVSWAKPGSARGSSPVRFPSPVGLRYGTPVTAALTLAPAGSALSSLLVDIDGAPGSTEYAVVDDAEFLAAVCWAAGVIAAPSIGALPMGESAKVMTPADVAVAYVEACQSGGIIIARQEPE